MTSNLLNSIGLGFIDIAYILIGLLGLILILFILLCVQIAKVSKLNKRYQIFMQGKDGKDLEKEIQEIFEDNEILKKNSEKNKKDIQKIQDQLIYTFQKCSIIKYDAFHQMGGKLSFCLVMLNEKDDGFILNSVHSSDGCYSYTKEVKNGKCDIALGKEEEEALKMAIGEE